MFLLCFWVFSTWKKVGLFIWTNLNSLVTQRLDVLCQVWKKLGYWFRRRRFLNFVNFVFGYFVIISLWKRKWCFILTNLSVLFGKWAHKCLRSRFLQVSNMHEHFREYIIHNYVNSTFIKIYLHKLLVLYMYFKKQKSIIRTTRFCFIKRTININCLYDFLLCVSLSYIFMRISITN